MQFHIFFTNSAYVGMIVFVFHFSYWLLIWPLWLFGPYSGSFFCQSVLRWSVAVFTICGHSSPVEAFLQEFASPNFRGPRSASIARSQVWLGLPAGCFQSIGRYLSDTRCKGSMVVLARWTASNMAEEPVAVVEMICYVLSATLNRFHSLINMDFSRNETLLRESFVLLTEPLLLSWSCIQVFDVIWGRFMKSLRHQLTHFDYQTVCM